MKSLTPYQLGESKSIEAIPYLLDYLKNGIDNERFAAVAAIYKISKVYNNECKYAIPLLIDNLTDNNPQFRQYTLKALYNFKLSSYEIDSICKYYYTENKKYNLQLFEQIISGDNNLNLLELKLRRKEQLEFIDTKKNRQSKSNYFNLKDIDKKLIEDSIILTVKINTELNFPLSNSNLVSMLKGSKWPIIEKYSDFFFTHGILNNFKSEDIKHIFNEKYLEKILIYNDPSNKEIILSNLGNNLLQTIEKSINKQDSNLNHKNSNKVSTSTIRDRNDLINPKILNAYYLDKNEKILKNKIPDFNNINFSKIKIDIKKIIDLSNKINFNSDEYVTSFYEIINLLISKSKISNRDSKIFYSRLNGLDNNLNTLQEVGETYNLTRERIRQICNKQIHRIQYLTLNNLNVSNIIVDFLKILSNDKNELDYIYLSAIFLKLNNYYSIDKCSMLLFTLMPIKNKQKFIKWVKEDIIEEQHRINEEQMKKELQLSRYKEQISKFDDWFIENTIFPANLELNSELHFYNLQQERNVNFDNSNSGVFFCEKMNTEIQYESNLEYRLLSKFSQSFIVKAYKVQSLVIPYRFQDYNRLYYPDIQILTNSNQIIIVEIKPSMRMVNYQNLIKYKAMESYCEENGFGFIVMDNRTNLKKLMEREVYTALSEEIINVLKHKEYISYSEIKLILEKHNCIFLDLYSVILNKNLKLLDIPFFQITL